MITNHKHVIISPGNPTQIYLDPKTYKATDIIILDAEVEIYDNRVTVTGTCVNHRLIYPSELRLMKNENIIKEIDPHEYEIKTVTRRRFTFLPPFIRKVSEDKIVMEPGWKRLKKTDKICLDLFGSMIIHNL